MKKLAVKAQLKLMEAKDKIKKMSGEVNTVEVLVIIAVFLLVTYPIYSRAISTFMLAVEKWFSGQETGVFHS